MTKTNVMRLLDAAKIPYRAAEYEVDENDLNGHELNNLDIVHNFLCAYCIDSISEDALLKNFYRWRENIRKRKKRREYKKKLKNG